MKKIDFSFKKTAAAVLCAAAFVFAGCDNAVNALQGLINPQTPTGTPPAEVLNAADLKKTFEDANVKVIAIKDGVNGGGLELVIPAGNKTISIPGGKETAIGSLQLSAGSHVTVKNADEAAAANTQYAAGGALAAVLKNEAPDTPWAVLVIWDHFKIPDGATFDLIGRVRLIFRSDAEVAVDGKLKADLGDSVAWTGGGGTVGGAGKVEINGAESDAGSAVISTDTAYQLAYAPQPGTDEDDGFVKVTGITGVPEMGAANTAITLTGTVVPEGATHKDIVWSVKTAGLGIDAGEIQGGTVTPTEAGVFTLTATVANGTAEGTDFTEDFPIGVWGAMLLIGETEVDGTYDGTLNGILAWINENGEAGADYLIRLAADQAVAPYEFPTNKEGIKITLEGYEGERKITWDGVATSGSGLFYIQNSGTLTLGNNITVDGKNSYIIHETQGRPVVWIQDAGSKLVMKDGSKITNLKVIHTTYSPAVTIFKGEFEMKGGQITGNAAADGVTAKMVYSSQSAAKFTMSGNAEISNNTNSDGVYVSCPFEMRDNAKISGNGGWGVYCSGIPAFDMYGGEISGNGGAVYLAKNAFTMTGGTISGNDSNAKGIYLKGVNPNFIINGAVSITVPIQCFGAHPNSNAKIYRKRF